MSLSNNRIVANFLSRCFDMLQNTTKVIDLPVVSLFVVSAVTVYTHEDYHNFYQEHYHMVASYPGLPSQHQASPRSMAAIKAVREAWVRG